MTREEIIEQLEKQNGKDWLAERESDIPILERVIKIMQLNCKNCVFRMGYGTGIDEGILNAIPKKMEEGE